ncbi:hypothetical protein [Microbacterium sp. Marseille-Q6648]|jgi:hypothetical protein|uniref:hypothetical protein n=1 Tax=Microbacterium sp. Marseille-Q6648 TaxID=2937991 RepID=UPI00203A9D1D|nr:hypothetical protein [Microbacterium sp. Marseille-Q6648]
MFANVNGWIVLLLTYGVGLVIVLLALYVVVRSAVLHALKAHTAWLEARRADIDGGPAA